MRETRVRVACIQPRAHDRRAFPRRLPELLALVDAACVAGARLVVLPEGTVPAYVIGTEPIDPELLAAAERDLSMRAIRYASTIVYGTVRISAGRRYNAAVAIGPDGARLGHADKAFLWHFDSRWFAPGATLEPIETPVGRLGLMVCADGRMPEIARTLVERGAEMLVMPTAWVTSGRDPAALENLQADLFAGIRAYENGVPFVAANKCGVEAASVLYCGKSRIDAADGTSLARASASEEEIIRAEVVLGGARPMRVAPLRFARPSACDATRLRIAIAPFLEPAERDRLVRATAVGDADALLTVVGEANVAPDAGDDAIPVLVAGAIGVRCVAGACVAVVDDATMRDPGALPGIRLAGVDLVAWRAQGDVAFHAPLARTRAAELRAYVVAIDPRPGGRAFACDPDGEIVCGTIGDYRVAAFAYDRARTAATTIAPRTDVLAGLRAVRALMHATESRR